MAAFEIYARHGDWDFMTGRLTGDGIVQVEGLALKIDGYLKDASAASVAVLSGQAQRTQESAGIIARKLGLSVEVTHFLGDVTGRATAVDWMVEGLSGLFASYEAVVCVTHGQQSEALARKARNELFGVRKGPDIYELSPGGAYFINTGGVIFRDSDE
ncbi:histidine phosphatase family protein [Candidatus Gottesmanbacteria bacterium]|nr:histidine phosphatase family protein [Candidatus Gottesmanbacteria bacterium]